MPRIRLLNVSGTPYQMGYQHGRAYTEAIRELTEERVQLSSDENWTGCSFSRYEVLSLADLCLAAHYDYAPDLMQEIEGTADATGLKPAELLIANGFTDFIDFVATSGELQPQGLNVGNECTSFYAPNGLFGQTWDMHASATPHVILMRAKPKHDPAFMVFTLTGCVGMIGMNEAGIAVGINNLYGANGQPGVTWPFVVRKILQQTTLEAALDCITSAPLAGAHNYMLADRYGRGYNVEAMTTLCRVTPLNGQAFAHANRCIDGVAQTAERPLTEEWICDSDTRVQRAEVLLRQHKSATPQALMALTRDRANGSNSICSLAEAPFYSETCGAAIMRPETGEFWGVWGLPTQNEYERYVV